MGQTEVVADVSDAYDVLGNLPHLPLGAPKKQCDIEVEIKLLRDVTDVLQADLSITSGITTDLSKTIQITRSELDALKLECQGLHNDETSNLQNEVLSRLEKVQALQNTFDAIRLDVQFVKSNAKNIVETSQRVSARLEEERCETTASLQVLQAHLEKYVNETWRCLDDSVSQRIEDAVYKTTDVLSKKIDDVDHSHFTALEAIRKDLSVFKGNDENGQGACPKDVYAQLDTVSRDLRRLETFESSWEERLAQTCKDMDSKVTEVEKTMNVFETKLSDTQEIYCRRDKELMSAYEMQKGFWQDLREELQKELKSLHTDMKQLVMQAMDMAKEESVLTPAKGPNILQSNVESARTQTSNIFRTGDVSLRTAPKKQQSNVKFQGRDEHQQQKLISHQHTAQNLCHPWGDLSL